MLRVCCSIALLLCLWTLASPTNCYSVEEEIEELKMLYGDRVLDKPCDSVDECEDHHRIKKRFLFNTYCDAVLGCFPTDVAPFNERLVNFQPNARATVNTRFELFTRHNPTVGQLLSADLPNTITSSLFNPKRKTFVVVHGFLESSKASWFMPMTQELLQKVDCNVLNVDWGGLFASKTLYTQATANTRVVAAEIVHMINTMKRLNSLNPNDIHIIGHSLGAHIAGYVGSNITDIGRISGLDPAEPYFEGYSPAIRLDSGDARFVDVIHSDADSVLEIVKGEGGFGTKELSGHADFFPNGGEDQPACKNGIVDNVKLENNLYEGLKRFFACDHDRAVKYFTQSVNNCPFNSVCCSDYVDFENGKCSLLCNKDADHCNSMGYHAKKPSRFANRKYYLQTSGEGDFCATNYDVKVKLASDSYEASGTIDITFHGSESRKQLLRVNKSGTKLVAGQMYNYHAGVSNGIGAVVGLEVTWTKDLAWWRVVSKGCSWVGLCSSSLRIDEITLDDGRGKVLHFCGSGRDFPSGETRYLFYSASACV